MNGFKKQKQNKLEFEKKVFFNKGEPFTIIEYYTTNNITIQFEDGTVVKNKVLDNLKTSRIPNPNKRTILNIGFVGQGKYLSRLNKKSYLTWSNMLSRCYSKEFLDKHLSYKGCSVHPDWHNFQNFAKWFEENYVDGFELDKDILVKGNKIYGPETCCFVPHEINNLFIKSKGTRGELPIRVSKQEDKFGSNISIRNKIVSLGTFNTSEEAFQAYKISKEKYIKEVIRKHINQIPHKFYQVIYNYEVKITD